MSAAPARVLRTALCAAALLLLASAVPPRSPAETPRVLEAGAVAVVYWPGSEGLAERTLRAATAPMLFPGIGRVQALEAGTIMLAPSAAVFDSLTGGRAPHWSAGVAIPAQQLVILPVFPSPRTARQDPLTALRHELAHLALNRHLQAPIPRWFDEGYATWASGEFDASAGWQIRLALLRGRLPPLDSLSLSWPEAEGQARLAYLLAASAVEFLATRGSEQAFATFLQVWRDQQNMQVALRSVYLTTFDRFESDWRTMVRQRYGWLLAIAQIGFFWVAVTVLFLALGLLRRRRDRARLAAMEAQERMHPPGEGGEDHIPTAAAHGDLPQEAPAHRADGAEPGAPGVDDGPGVDGDSRQG